MLNLIGLIIGLSDTSFNTIKKDLYCNGDI